MAIYIHMVPQGARSLIIVMKRNSFPCIDTWQYHAQADMCLEGGEQLDVYAERAKVKNHPDHGYNNLSMHAVCGLDSIYPS